jgi:hypothetical protein
MFAAVCLEVLLATIVAWVGVWGLVEEMVLLVESRIIRCCMYAILPSSALLLAAVQGSITVCALL